MGAGRRFRVALKAKRRLVGAGQTLQRAVKQADVRRPQIGGQRGFIDRKTVVLTGDADAAGVQVFDRMVRAVVAELHLKSLGPAGQRHDLMTQANAEGRDAGFNQFAHRFNRVVASLRIARAVGQENTVRIELEHVSSRGLRRHHGNARAAFGDHAKDVLFHAKVIGDDMKARRDLNAIA